MSFLPLYVYFIFFSFVTSLSVYFFSKSSFFYLKLFPPFLLATLIAEIVGSYLSALRKPNVAIYNFFTVFEFCFYLYVISLIISNRKMKNTLLIVIALYSLTAVMNIVFFQGMGSFHTLTYAFGCLLIVGACMYYFFELFKFPNSIDLKTNPAFWICSGLLFFYCCGFPLFGFTNLIAGISKLIMRNLYRLIIILNIFLYTLFAVGFICQLKVKKYTLLR